jgi:L-fucose isomerase-like protein
MDGGIAVCQIPGLNQVMDHICKNGFEHHVAMVRGHYAGAIKEALETYLKWDSSFIQTSF